MSTKQESPELRAAQAAMTAASRVYMQAKMAWNKTAAEWSRLMLIDLAEEFPVIEAFEFDVTYEYDDEGGYFASVNGRAVLTAEAQLQQEENENIVEDFWTEISDIGLDNETVAMLCGTEVDKDAKITVAQLRELSFA